MAGMRQQSLNMPLLMNFTRTRRKCLRHMPDRNRDSKALIVFLTSFTKYMPDVFEVVTFDYIQKPITIERLRLLLEKAETYLGMTNQSFSFSYGRSRYSLKFGEILYLEKRGRQALIHTKDTIYRTNMTTKEIWECLDERMFAAICGRRP